MAKKTKKKAKPKKATKGKSAWGKATGDGHLGFKVDGAERKKIKANAEKYAGGNVSLWLCHAAINHKGHVPET